MRQGREHECGCMSVRVPASTTSLATGHLKLRHSTAQHTTKVLTCQAPLSHSKANAKRLHLEILGDHRRLEFAKIEHLDAQFRPLDAFLSHNALNDLIEFQ
jgi:hypothetical protein